MNYEDTLKKNTKGTDTNTPPKPQYTENLWHPIYLVPIVISILVLVLPSVLPLPLTQLATLTAVLCVFALFFTAITPYIWARNSLSKEDRKATKIIQTVTKKQEKDASEKEEWLEESPAVALGTQGIYGIVYGLGISEALSGYLNLLSNKSTNLQYSAPLGLLGTVGLAFPDTFRSSSSRRTS
jgi:hypothetical protein